MKSIFNKVQKNISRQETACQYWKFHRITHKTILCTFWLHENIFITLQCSGDILGIFLKKKFMEFSSNILGILPGVYWNLPKDQHFFSSNHTFLKQKQFFHQEFVKKYYIWRCSLNVPWISRTLQRWENTQRIFPEYCVLTGLYLAWVTKRLIQHFLKGIDDCNTSFVFQQNSPSIFVVNINNT